MNGSVLITGSSRGIGLAIAKKLSTDGCNVLGISRHESKQNFPGTLYNCDLSNIDETEKTLNKISQEHEVLTIINNLGCSFSNTISSADFHTFNRMMNLNVWTTIQVTQHFIGAMKKKQYGRIVNMSSLAIYGVKNRSIYAAAKSAIVGLTRTWALELAEFSITVNAIAPGGIETDMLRKMRPINSAEEKELLTKIPLARFGKPEEVAALISLLTSDNGGFITGQILSIDGGASI